MFFKITGNEDTFTTLTCMTIHVALWACKHNIHERDPALNKEKSWLATPTTEFNRTYHYSVTFACSLLTSICFSFFLLHSNSFKCQLPVRSQLLLWHVTYFHVSGQSGSFPLHSTQCPVGHQQVRLYHDSRASISSNQCASPSTSPISCSLDSQSRLERMEQKPRQDFEAYSIRLCNASITFAHLHVFFPNAHFSISNTSYYTAK